MEEYTRCPSASEKKVKIPTFFTSFYSPRCAMHSLEMAKYYSFQRVDLNHEGYSSLGFDFDPGAIHISIPVAKCCPLKKDNNFTLHSFDYHDLNDWDPIQTAWIFFCFKSKLISFFWHDGFSSDHSNPCWSFCTVCKLEENPQFRLHQITDESRYIF